MIDANWTWYTNPEKPPEVSEIRERLQIMIREILLNKYHPSDDCYYSQSCGFIIRFNYKLHEISITFGKLYIDEFNSYVTGGVIRTQGKIIILCKDLKYD